MVQSWLNSDSLYLKYGVDKGTATIGGEYRNVGPLREIEVRIPLLTALTTVPAIISDAIFFPANVRIEEVEVVTHTVAATSTLASINLGLIRTDRTTAIDLDGFIADLALPKLDVAGEKNVLRVGTSNAGAMIGTNNTGVPGYIIASQGSTLPFTAGAVDIRIRYYNH